MSTNQISLKIIEYAVIFLGLISIACAGLARSTEINTIVLTQTSIAQTSAALEATSVQTVFTEQFLTETPTMTVESQQDVPEQQTEPPPPPDTPEPGAPVISANINTNCREGPTVDYKVLGYLIKNQTSEVYGRDNTKNWWYIANPEKPNQYCWVWTETTTVSGDTTNLPVITPPPPVVPVELSYTATFSGVGKCSGKSLAIFQIKNGDIPLESLGSTLTYPEGGSIFATGLENAPFMGSSSECPPGGGSVQKGLTSYISAGELPEFMIVETTVRATIELCTQDDLKGDCLTKVIDFTH